MHRGLRTAAAAGMLAAYAAAAAAQGAAETKAQRDARMAWWREAKFGLFIHWGVYAVPAGTYKGEQIPGIGEWIMLRGKIPVAEYKAFAKEFNPVKYDPQAWVALAKEAGMKYIVITSKHHDGFGLWDSKVSGWDIAGATPYKKDLLAPLCDAAKRAGLKMGFYYSQAQDWTHPGGAKSGLQEGGGWDEAHKGDFDAYLRDIAAPQTRELLETYPLDIFWWDTPQWMNNERAAPLHALLALRPGIISNNRLGGDYIGDTETPEQHIPATGFKDRDWEVCMTMNDTWGFKSYDDNWKPTQDLVRKLCDIASKGGNFLLNVGPTAEGLIPQESIDRLKAIGAWMRVNGEAIYGTSASPFPNLPWGRCTRKVGRYGPFGLLGKTTTLYLHVFDWPADGKLLVPDLKNDILGAELLAGGAKLDATLDDAGAVIRVPAQAPDPIASVVVLRVRGEVETLPFIVKQEADGKIDLRPDAAELNGRLQAHGFIHVNFQRWTNPEDFAEWTVQVDKAGTFDIAFQAGAVSPAKIVLAAAGKRHEFAIEATGDVRKYKAVKTAPVQLDAGRQTIRLEAVAEGWNPVNVRTMTLTPKAK